MPTGTFYMPGLIIQDSLMNTHRVLANIGCNGKNIRFRVEPVTIYIYTYSR